MLQSQCRKAKVIFYEVNEKKCPHGKRKSRCKDCGGNAICDHKILRIDCRNCGGTRVSKCHHGFSKKICKICNPQIVCQHSRIKYRCDTCKNLRKAQKDKEDQEVQAIQEAQEWVEFLDDDSICDTELLDDKQEHPLQYCISTPQNILNILTFPPGTLIILENGARLKTTSYLCGIQI
jgi:hypothetical protein